MGWLELKTLSDEDLQETGWNEPAKGDKARKRSISTCRTTDEV